MINMSQCIRIFLVLPTLARCFHIHKHACVSTVTCGARNPKSSGGTGFDLSKYLKSTRKQSTDPPDPRPVAPETSDITIAVEPSPQPYRGPVPKGGVVNNVIGATEIEAYGVIVEVGDSVIVPGGRGLFLRLAPSVSPPPAAANTRTSEPKQTATTAGSSSTGPSFSSMPKQQPVTLPSGTLLGGYAAGGKLQASPPEDAQDPCADRVVRFSLEGPVDTTTVLFDGQLVRLADLLRPPTPAQPHYFGLTSLPGMSSPPLPPPSPQRNKERGASDSSSSSSSSSDGSGGRRSKGATPGSSRGGATGFGKKSRGSSSSSSGGSTRKGETTTSSKSSSGNTRTGGDNDDDGSGGSAQGGGEAVSSPPRRILSPRPCVGAQGVAGHYRSDSREKDAYTVVLRLRSESEEATATATATEARAGSNDDDDGDDRMYYYVPPPSPAAAAAAAAAEALYPREGGEEEDEQVSILSVGQFANDLAVPLQRPQLQNGGGGGGGGDGGASASAVVQKEETDDSRTATAPPTTDAAAAAMGAAMDSMDAAMDAYESASKARNVCVLLWRLEARRQTACEDQGGADSGDGGDINDDDSTTPPPPLSPLLLWPTFPVLAIEETLTLDNAEPMEIGCRYGFDYWLKAAPELLALD